MRIAHIVARISEEASGPSYAVPSLADAQIRLGHDVELHTLAAPQEVPAWVVTHDQTLPSKGRLGSSASLRRASQVLTREFDIVHVHGLWMMPNVYPFRRRTPGAKRVLSPHGTTLPPALSHHAWRKRLFWSMTQRRALRADAVHATSEAEATSIEQFGFDSPVFVVPIGIETDLAAGVNPASTRHTVLYLGRLHPIKGLDLLLRAWAPVEDARPDWDLVLVGPPEAGMDRHLDKLSTELRLARATIRGPVYGDAKNEILRAADLYVLPTRSENFGITVLEALAQGTPVVTTEGAPWSGLTEHECGWWVEASVEGIRDALFEATSKPRSELRDMGSRGRIWAAQSFSWQSVAKRTVDFYKTLLD